MMLVKIEDLRVACGIDAADTSKDAVLTEAYTTALAIIETYLDRKLERGGQFESFVPVDGSAQLIRYPVDPQGFNYFTDETGQRLDPQPDYKMDIDYTKGIMFFKGRAPDLIRVEYIGGYTQQTLPKALGLAIIRVTRGVFFDMMSPAPTDLGGVKRITVPDVGTIEYSEAGQGAELLDNPYLDGGSMMLLDSFRRWQV